MKIKYTNGNTMKINEKNPFDEYFTKPEISAKLYQKTCEIIAQYEPLSKYTWLEPSVGEGCFFSVLPKKKIGIDIRPTRFNTIQCDYLEFALPKKPLIVIGNPPFGHRGVMALEFINHSQQAEFVAFILPMFFQSLGKGSIRYRVKNFNLLYEEPLPKNSFYTAEGKEKDVKCCFQIWSKKYKRLTQEFSWYRQKEKEEPFQNLIRVVTVSLAKNRECGKKWIFDKKADFYLSSTFFKENNVVKEFESVKYKSGIAIIYTTKKTKERQRLNQIFQNANWTKYSSLATNGCRHIGKSHVFQLLTDEGFENGNQ